jgi:His-Xaa-Ser system radical SAM maturase HxsB
MNLFPYKFRRIKNKYLVTNESGGFFFCQKDSLNKLLSNNIDALFEDYLKSRGFTFYKEGDIYWNSFAYKLTKRKHIKEDLSYFMIIPTLRCNLKCSYCQVSRVNEDKQGYDWDDLTISQFFDFVKAKNTSDSIKIEFQGGEPTLRLDIIKQIIDWCDANYKYREFAICTNLQKVSTEMIELIERDDVVISTSLDGVKDLHNDQRIQDKGNTNSFFANLEMILAKYGPSKISALPTFTDFTKINDTIDLYRSYGFEYIFLRPVNFQGFARKNFPESKSQVQIWNEVYQKALDKIFNDNYSSGNHLTEYSFEVTLKRIFNNNFTNHVDLRSPNYGLKDYAVIDHEGSFFTSDEARMITRISVSDLSMGNLRNGINNEKLAAFNYNQINETDPDCIHCAHQSYCGVDTIDDLSRYQRIDIPKKDTDFCENNMSKFDHVFERLLDCKPSDFYNISGHLTDHYTIDPCFGRYIYD